MLDNGIYVLANGHTSADLQAAIDVARPNKRLVILEPGAWPLTTMVTIWDGVPLQGIGADEATILTWQGDPNGIALNFQGCWNYASGGFTVRNGNAARGNSVGMLFSGPQSGGTQGGGATWEHLLVYGFHNNIQIGEAGGAANSEMVFRNCKLRLADKGVLAVGFNTLDLGFDTLQMSECGVGIHAETAGCVRVYGAGASTDNVIDFQFDAGGLFSVRDFRSETVKDKFLRAGASTSCTSVLLDHCEVGAQAIGGDGVLINSRGGGLLHIQGGFYRGKIGVDRDPAVSAQPSDTRKTVVLDGVALTDSQLIRAMGSADGARVDARGCQRVDLSGALLSHFPSGSGTIVNGALIWDASPGAPPPPSMPPEPIYGSRRRNTVLARLLQALQARGVVVDLTDEA